jgi:predicted ribosomally synthesized peptide with SipW-like signal peptide
MTEPTEPTYIVVQQAPPPEKKKGFPRWALFAVGALLLGGAGAGTFASFSASTTNSATFATGTLVLSDKVDAGTTCYSTGSSLGDTSTNTDTNANANCAALFTMALNKPGDEATAELDLKNEGSVDGSALQLYANTCSTGDVATETFHGSGDLCPAVLMTIQEYDSATNRTNDDVSGTNGNCRYGATTGANVACAFGGTATLGNLPLSGSPLGLGAFQAGATRYLRIRVQLPQTATNDVQGRQVSTSLTWRVIQ